MSWTEVKHALNSGLGTANFLPLDEQIKETVDLATLPAGGEDFSRTAFERSALVAYTIYKDTSDLNSRNSFFNYAKFIAPLTGVYRISYEYNFWYTYTPNVLNAGNAHFKWGLFGSTEKPNIINVVDMDKYYAMNIGLSTDLFTAAYAIELLPTLIIPTLTQTFVNVTKYIYTTKGNPIVISGYFTNSMAKLIDLTFSVKNFKITY